MTDENVKKVRKTRARILQRFGSMERYNEHLMEKQMEYGSRLVMLSPKRISPKPEKQPPNAVPDC